MADVWVFTKIAQPGSCVETITLALFSSIAEVSLFIYDCNLQNEFC